MFRRIRELLGASSSTAFTTAPTTGTEPNGPLLEMRGVTKIFVVDKVETHALRHVDLAVERGEFVAINGPSGSGKSTLLSIAGLMDTPTSGSYHLNGADVTELSAKARAVARNREVGFIFQSFNLIGDLTVAENVELPLTYQGLAAAERRQRVTEALSRFELSERAQQMPGQLSGGHQQRVAVARAVVGRPQVLLADEPTGNLNSQQAEAVIDMLVELNHGGTTILLVTHDPRWRRVVAREVELFDGAIVPAQPEPVPAPPR